MGHGIKDTARKAFEDKQLSCVLVISIYVKNLTHFLNINNIISIFLGGERKYLNKITKISRTAFVFLSNESSDVKP